MNDFLATPIQYVKGVGPKTGKHLESLGILTLKDLFYYFPRAYEDRRRVPLISDARIDESMFFVGKVVSVKTESSRNRMNIFKARIADESGSLTVVWFNQPFLGTTIKPGREIFVAGKVEYNRFQGEPQLLCSDYELLGAKQDNACPVVGRVVPLYGLTRGITQKRIRTLVFEALTQYVGKTGDYYTAAFRSANQLVSLSDAVMQLHFPRDRDAYRLARRRIVFDEFFFIQLVLAQKRYLHRSCEKGISFCTESSKYRQYLGQLPYTLTGAQQRVISEIMHDMARPVPMNRLVQGDVGSGKTEVAVAAIITAIENGYQAALMAPTEILAEQHYRKMVRHLEPLGIRVELLTGRVASRQKQNVREYLSSNMTQVVVGTHALIQESVSIPNLGLAIVDEQHRFGVLQRAALKGQGHNPDLLVMTATPIPRTLSLTLYGDLDKSVIDQLPPGRKPIKTIWCKRATEIYEFIREKLRAGEQVYYVLPLVEESEKLDLKAAIDTYEHLRTAVFPDVTVGLIHGRMKGDDKDRVMIEFREKDIQLLVATTVIEVGIDVPNASVMVIEHAERFGLSQLHQLRGRVGRGTNESFCILIGNPKSPEARKRIKVMTETTDGFKIAECDLEIRGSGDYYGIRQSGLPSLRYANLVKDETLLLQARRAAEEVIEQDVDLAHESSRGMKKELESRQEYTVTHHGMN